MRDDPEWLAQKVRLSKKCYEVLSERLVFLAKQSERLEEIKNSFRNGYLDIMSKSSMQGLNHYSQKRGSRVQFSKSVQQQEPEKGGTEVKKLEQRKSVQH